MALLGRQIWCLVNNKDTLCYKLLSSKYFPDGDPLHPKNVYEPSFAWSSLCAVAKESVVGFGWQIGNRRNVQIREQHWGFEGLSWEALSNVSNSDGLIVVHYL